MEETDYTGLNPSAVGIIKITPQIRSIKITRMGANLKTFAGSINTYRKNIRINANGKRVKCRLYCPKIKSDKCLVYYHGGGFMYGGLNTADGGLRNLCDLLGCNVLSVDYSLAPESPYPNAINETFELTNLVIKNKKQMGFEKIYLGGDSAGGNIACVTTARLVEKKRPVDGLILFYPFVEVMYDNIEKKYPSIEKFGKGYFLSKADLEFMTDHYLPPQYDTFEPTISPIYADLNEFPRTIVFVAGYDPLHDMGVAFHEKLTKSGVDSKLVKYEDMIHGFFSLFEDYALRAIKEINGFFKINEQLVDDKCAYDLNGECADCRKAKRERKRQLREEKAERRKSLRNGNCRASEKMAETDTVSQSLPLQEKKDSESFRDGIAPEHTGQAASAAENIAAILTEQSEGENAPDGKAVNDVTDITEKQEANR